MGVWLRIWIACSNVCARMRWVAIQFIGLGSVPQRQPGSSGRQCFSLNHRCDWTYRRCGRSLGPTSIGIYPGHSGVRFVPAEIVEKKPKCWEEKIRWKRIFRWKEKFFIKNAQIYEKPRFLLITHVNCQLLYIFRIGCIDSIIWINVAANFWLNSVRHDDYSLCLLFGNVTSKFFFPRWGKKILITLIWRKRRAKCYKFYWQSVLVAVISLCVLFDWAICQNWCIIKSMCWVLYVRRRCYRLNKFSVVKAFKRFSCSFAICRFYWITQYYRCSARQSIAFLFKF